jgi:hypothetical protein
MEEYAATGAISGYCFNDENENGLMDDGEEGLAGMSVSLKKIILFIFQRDMGTVNSDAAGRYAFSNLSRGRYTVEAQSEEDKRCSTQNPIATSIGFLNKTRNFDFGYSVSTITTTTTTTTTIITTTTSTTTSTICNEGKLVILNRTAYDLRNIQVDGQPILEPGTYVAPNYQAETCLQPLPSPDFYTVTLEIWSHLNDTLYFNYEAPVFIYAGKTITHEVFKEVAEIFTPNKKVSWYASSGAEEYRIDFFVDEKRETSGRYIMYNRDQQAADWLFVDELTTIPLARVIWPFYSSQFSWELNGKLCESEYPWTNFDCTIEGDVYNFN